MNFAQGRFLAILIVVLCDGGHSCSPASGPAGENACISISRYSGKQYASCLTNTYIQLKSGGKHICEITSATYCYYQCMIEMHNSNSGTVTPDCSCTDSTGVTPTAFTGTTLPPYCYSPSGTDFTWYADCLERKYPCGAQTGYALTFGKKYCELYAAHYSWFADLTKRWVDAVRKCLQVALVPLMRQYNQPTCDQVKQTAIDTHTDCYTKPGTGQPSICDVIRNSCPEIFPIFFTIGGGFIETDATVFIGSWKSAWEVFQICSFDFFTCCRSPMAKYSAVCTAKYLYQFVIEKVRSGRVGRSVGSDDAGDSDDTAVKFARSLSDSLGWKALGIDWIPLTSNYTQTGAIAFSLLVGDQRALNLNSNLTNKIDMQAEMLKLKTKVQNGEVLLRLSDGNQFYTRQLSECSNSNCSAYQSVITSPADPKSEPTTEPKRELNGAGMTAQTLGTVLLGLLQIFVVKFGRASLC